MAGVSSTSGSPDGQLTLPGYERVAASHVRRLALPARNLFETNEVVSSHYRVRALLGAGGMGQVFEALDQPLNRHVAIKANWPYVDAALLRQEAQILAAIRHPGIVTVHGLGHHNGVDYFVMELIRGVALSRRIRDSLEAGRLVELDEALDILVPLADALAAVHHAGLAHRDVKSSNIMLAPGNRVVLMDFGISSSEAQAHEQGGVISGTIDYMAPETALGRVDLGQVFLVDVYSLGVVAFELLTGQLPFDGERPSELLARRAEQGPPVIRNRRDVPPALSTLLV
jgi:serine/threonine-protein kinase